MAWDEAEDKSYAELKDFFETTYPEDSKFRKVNEWYRSCMDTERADELGAEPLRPWLEQVDKIQVKAGALSRERVGGR